MNALKIPLLTAAVLAGTVAAVAQTPTPTAPIKKAAFSAPVKVMTFSVRELKTNDGLNHWYHRRVPVYKTITGSGADIVVLQDALKSQADEIKKGCPDYEMIEGFGGNGGTNGAMCPILYNPKRLKSAASEFFWFSSNPAAPSKGYGNPDPMICNSAKFIEIESGNPFTLFNVKWTAFPASARGEAAQQMARKIVDDKANATPYIVCGDFGAAVNDQGIGYLMLKRTPAQSNRYYLGMQEAFLGKAGPGSFHQFSPSASTIRPDLIFFSSDWKVTGAEVLTDKVDRRYASDHFPVVATATWERIIRPVPAVKPVAPKAETQTDAADVTPAQKTEAAADAKSATEAKPAVKPAAKPVADDDNW